MTTRDETAARRVARPSRTPLVQPPPRPGRRPATDPDPLTLRPAARRGHGWMWLSAALFAALGVAALGVFFVLPDWVRARQELLPPEVAAAAAAPATDPGPGPPVVTETTPAVAETTPRRPAAAAAGDGEAPKAPDPAPTARAASGAARAPASAPPKAAPPPAAAAPAQSGDDAFARAMSAGLAALDREDYAAARDAFSRAAEVRPGSTQSADGLLRAETALRLAAIRRLRDEAVAFAAGEDWKAAAERYEAVLGLDPTVSFALEGRARSRGRADLADRLDFHAGNPQRLSSDAVLREASTILAQAREIDPAGPRHGRQVAALATHVAAYSTTVRAVLESDELTDVTVYRVGRLGVFRRHALDLRPGTYTVVGSRRGYRDVRRQLVIAPGVAPPPLAVRCEEKV